MTAGPALCMLIFIRLYCTAPEMTTQLKRHWSSVYTLLILTPCLHAWQSVSSLKDRIIRPWIIGCTPLRGSADKITHLNDQSWAKVFDLLNRLRMEITFHACTKDVEALKQMYMVLWLMWGLPKASAWVSRRKHHEKNINRIDPAETISKVQVQHGEDCSNGGQR
jgi:hypothetical protein